VLPGIGEESVINHATYAQPYFSLAAYCGASPENMQRTRVAALAGCRKGCYHCENKGESARYKALELVLNQIKGAPQRVSFAA
jgi:hypothetical protein